MTDEQLRKLEQGKKKAKEMNGLVCQIKDVNDNFEIWADKNQYTLITNNNQDNKTYHHSIESVLNDLLKDKEKKLMIASNQKDLISVRKAVLEARSWMQEIVHPLIKSSQ